MKRQFLILSLGLTFVVWVGPTIGAQKSWAQEAQVAQAGAVEQRVNYKKFVDFVARFHPEKPIDQLVLASSQVQEKKLGRLPDPQLTLSGEDFPLEQPMDQTASTMEEKTPQQKWRLNFTQSFPWPGTLEQERKKGATQSKKVEVAGNLEQAKRILRARELFIEMVTTQKLLKIERENLKEVENILLSAQTRLRYGIGSHHDSIEAHHEKILLNFTIEAMEANLEGLKDRAAQMMGRQSAGGIFFDLDSGMNDEHTSPQPIAQEDLTKVQIALEEGVAREKKELDKFRASASFSAGGMLMKEGNMNTYGIMVGFTLPLYSGGLRDSLDEEYLLAVKKSKGQQAFHDMQKAMVLKSLAKREKIAKAQFEGLKNQIVPSAQEHLRTIATEYGIGKTSFATVNTARRQLLRYQESKVYAEKELALIGVSRERIGYGILEMDIDRLMPNIAQGENMGGGMKAADGMGRESMGQINDGMTSPRSSRSPVRRGLESNVPMEEDDGSTSNKGSMGDM